MAEKEGGQWDVGVKDNVIFVARLNDDGERLFEDQLAPEEARHLAELLRKYAGKVDESKPDDRSTGKDEDDDKDDDKDDKDDRDKKQRDKKERDGKDDDKDDKDDRDKKERDDRNDDDDDDEDDKK
ncbi:hypothetical protein [Mycobacterium sp. ITM-2016-00318]|uniref:hypothetical protein n=1 Tax=Mycobacterium sp. ITM-2016-00318 TaxID=2099693 RepID=UPI000CF84E54|nr:hypothetical protein [Mycobacterium sp. ITM-2016-00318]WNG94520.1 hypothetical protein C6A82_008870 [Mycobacterium sp. ITM-2016-00318]